MLITFRTAIIGKRRCTIDYYFKSHLYSLQALFIRSYLDAIIYRIDEYLAIARIAGMSIFLDRSYNLINHFIWNDQFYLGLMDELDKSIRAQLFGIRTSLFPIPRISEIVIPGSPSIL